jgi:hypothetical protein
MMLNGLYLRSLPAPVAQCVDVTIIFIAGPVSKTRRFGLLGKQSLLPVENMK